MKIVFFIGTARRGIYLASLFMDQGGLIVFKIFIACGGLFALGYKLLIFNSVLLEDIKTITINFKYKQ